MKTDLFNESHRATYCPEDNKLRLYVGRVPRPEYEALRAEGWTSTPKQGCDFVAHWTPSRRDTCESYAGIIEDEDQGPDERAADRAERFGGYLDKRLGEAGTHADHYDSGPNAHGFQSQARAERAAERHDKIGTRAVDAWSKAEYWQRRTAGVISHALHVCSPSVRMGRIKELEADIRKAEKSREDYAKLFSNWQAVAKLTDPTHKRKAVNYLAQYDHGDYMHPVTGKRVSLYVIAEDEAIPADDCAALWLASHGAPAPEGDWLTHYRLRLAYENQMLEAQGGRAAFVEMIPGGFIGSRQIQKVNKSPATGRVVSVQVWGTTSGFTRASGYKEYATVPALVTMETERLPADAYRAPTDEELAAFEAEKKARKAAAPKKTAPALINPTDEDAARLVEMWNTARRAKHDANPLSKYSAELKPCEVRKMPQAFYSAHSKGAHARAETRGICAEGRLEARNSFYDYGKKDTNKGPVICQLRTTGFDPVHVIILTDKPQKPLPAAVWQAVETEVAA